MTDDKQMQLEKGIDRMNGRYDCKPKNDDCTVSASQVCEDQELHAIEFAKWMVANRIYNDSAVGRENWKSSHTDTDIDGISSSELYELFIKTKQ